MGVINIEERKSYIGGTDVSGILGLSRYRTPLQVWSEKTGKIEPTDISDKLQVKCGIKIEPVVCELWEEETGKKLHKVNNTLFHSEHSFFGANIDRRVVGEKAGFEAKTASAYMEKDWDHGEIPAEYLVQVYWYLYITGWEKWYIGCLIGNHRFETRVVERDEKIIANIEKKALKFWNEFVVPQVMPSVIKAEDGNTLYQLFPEADPESVVELGDDAEKVLESIEAYEQDKFTIEKLIDEQKNTLKAMLKDKEIGRSKNWKVTWKNISKKEYVVPAKSYRELRKTRIKTKGE